MYYGPRPLDAQIRLAWLDGQPGELLIQQPDHWDYVGRWSPDGASFHFNSFGRGKESRSHIYETATGRIMHDLGHRSVPTWDREARTAVWVETVERSHFELAEIRR